MARGQTKPKVRSGDAKDQKVEKLTAQLIQRNRQLEIEAALEKVRARAMAMHESAELAETSAELFHQLKELKIDALRTGLGIFDDPNDAVELWLTTASKGKEVVKMLDYVNMHIHPVFEAVMLSRKKRKSFALSVLKGNEVKQYYETMARMGLEKSTHNPVECFYSFFFAEGSINVITTKELTKEESNIMIRMAGAFGLIYRRFLDLKKAETQAREAKIELALERIRTRTMAMHKSDELVDTSVILFQELKALGISAIRTGVAVYHEEQQTVEVWTSQLFEKKQNPVLGVIPISFHPFFEGLHHAWKSKDQDYTYTFSGDEVKKYYQATSSLLAYPNQKTFNSHEVFSPFFFAEGNLTVVSHQPLTEEERNIMHRFASVFGLIYRRFLDLQKAEAQAREAQIEASLERVRARASALRESKELREVILLIFRELKKLGLDLFECNLLIFDDEPKNLIHWGSGTDDSEPNSVKVPFFDHPFLKDLFDDLEKGVKYRSGELSGSLLKSFIKRLFSETDFKHTPPEYIAAMNKIERLFYSHAVMKHGFLEIVGDLPLPEDKASIVKRFTNVIDLTYTRFNDVVKAEAQAREAQIEASLERVRSKTMAMHNSQDVGGTVATLFAELVKLGVDKSIRCGVGIMDDSDKMEVWAASSSSDDQVGLILGKLDMTSHPLLNDIKKAWKNKEPSYFYELKEEELISYYKVINDSPDYPIQVDLATLPNRIIHNSFSFPEGILFSFSENPIPDGAVQVFKRFAQVFSQTYKRFLDLQKAEAQAREGQIEVALERVRARTMSMQNSNELTEAANNLFLQVQALGIPAWSAGYCIWENEDKQIASCNMSSQGKLQKSFFLPTIGEGYDFYAPLQQGETFFVVELAGKELAKHYEFMRTLPVVGEILDELFEAGFPVPTFQIFHIVYFPHGYLMFITYEAVPEVHDIFKRFAKVFEQTYTRFLDLQKAEAQAREAQIELALERVRSRSMAMHKSEELAEVIAVISEQLHHLKVRFDNVSFATNIESDVFDFWISVSGWPEPYHVIAPLIDHPMMKRLMDAQRQGIKFYQDILTPEDNRAWLDHVFAHNQMDYLSAETKAYMSKSGFARSTALMPSIMLIVANYLSKPYSEEDNQIINRFASVFEQSYTRFLDLQKAESQTRKGHIELALERIRASTMAMQKSEELRDVITVVFQQFQELHFKIDAAYFNPDYKETDDLHCWVASTARTYPTKLEIPYFDNEVTNILNGAKKNGQELATGAVTFQEKNRFWEHFFKHAPIAPERQEYLLNTPGLAMSFVLMSNVQVVILNYQGVPFSDAENFVLIRFGKVFQQSYTRFLDLQKAEAQAREGHIEVTTERVRSKAMAMRSSEDIHTVVELLQKEVTALNVDGFTGTSIYLFDENEWISMYDFSDPGNLGQPGKRVAHWDSKAYRILGTEIREIWKKGGYSVVEYGPARLKEAAEELMKIDENIHAVIQKALDCGLHTQWDSFYSFSKGVIGFDLIKPPTEDTRLIVTKLTSAFDLAYKRFEDLKEAEAQAREATIEAALEKVRGKAMAMHNSNDLIATAGIVFSELRKLGINSFRSGVGLLTKEDRKVKLYAAMTSGEGGELSLIGWAMLEGHPVLVETYDAWIRNEDYFPELRGENIKSYYDQVRASYAVPASQSEILAQYGYFLPFSEGLFYGWSDKPYTETEIKTLKRFNAIIDLTFRRYIELQKSEANAKEAIRRASLDRVRAEIASMRSTKDLERITPLIWSELTTLGVPFVRCGVFIMDEERQVIHNYLSSPDGKPLAAFHLPYATQGFFAKALSHWQEREIFVDHLDQAAFAEIASTLVEQGAFDSEEQYLRTLSHSDLYANSLPFLQGTLYVANTAPLGEEEIKLVQSLADAFSTAYARYEDFNKLESAKKQVEKTVVDLKQAQSQLVQAEKMASLGELTAGIAHEIQNPLNFVNNFSEVSNELLDEMKTELASGNWQPAIQLAEDVKQNLQKILHHGKRADGIVKGMLQHSRSSSATKEPTDINKLADEYLRLAYHGLRAKDKSFNSKFETHFDENAGSINVIPQDIGRVVLNLITNAFYVVAEKSASAKATGDKKYEPCVIVTTKKVRNNILVSVKDNGSGIPQKVLEKIFQPFFTTKPTGKGTGLGLSISYDIVKAHGGELRVETREGEGSEFIIELPIV